MVNRVWLGERGRTTNCSVMLYGIPHRSSISGTLYRRFAQHNVLQLNSRDQVRTHGKRYSPPPVPMLMAHQESKQLQRSATTGIQHPHPAAPTVEWLPADNGNLSCFPHYCDLSWMLEIPLR